ncbi:MAG: hypothetical protein RL557_164 [archaeon]
MVTATSQYDFETVRRKIEKISPDEWKYDSSREESWYEHRTSFGSIVVGASPEGNYVRLFDRNNNVLANYISHSQEEEDLVQEFYSTFAEKMKSVQATTENFQKQEDKSKLEEWLTE